MTVKQNNSSPAFTRENRINILTTISKLVPERHINVSNPNQDYQPWLALIDKHAPRLIDSDDPEMFEAGVNELIAALGTSHTAFFHQRNNGVLAPGAINATLRAVDGPDGKRWMFVDVIEDGAAFRGGIHPGEILLSVDSVPLLPPQPAKFRIGATHQIEVGTLDAARRKVTIEVPDRAAKDRPPMVEPRSLSHRLLAPNVGYVRVATFPGTVGQSFAKELDLIIDDLKGNDVERLIIDVRGNMGGALGSLRLMSYLCPGKLEIGHSVTRRMLQKGYRKEALPRIGKIPATKLGLLVMAIRYKLVQRDRSIVLVTEGLGPQPFHGRTVVLINEHTRSAAEMVAGFAKQNRLASVVGTKTAGEVLGAANFKLAGGYVLRMPVAGWYTWQGDNIEGKGVEPDVAVENTAESLASGADTQLSKAIETVQALS